MKKIKFLLAFLALVLVIVSSAFTKKSTLSETRFGVLNVYPYSASENTWVYDLEVFNDPEKACEGNTGDCALTFDPESLPDGIVEGSQPGQYIIDKDIFNTFETGFYGPKQ